MIFIKNLKKSIDVCRTSVSFCRSYGPTEEKNSLLISPRSLSITMKHNHTRTSLGGPFTAVVCGCTDVSQSVTVCISACFTAVGEKMIFGSNGRLYAVSDDLLRECVRPRRHVRCQRDVQ